MRTKIEIANEFILILEQEGEEFVEMRLRNCEKSSALARPDQKQKNRNREIIRIDQFLDGQMKIQMQMGIPALFTPAESDQDGRPGASGGPAGPLPFSPEGQIVKHLLLGTESDPHVLHVDAGAPGEDVQEAAQDQSREHGENQNSNLGKPGKFLLKMNWMPDGQQ